MGYPGSGSNASSPGSMNARERWPRPSFDPMSGSTSMSASSSTPKRFRYHSATACRNSGIPVYEGYRWVAGSSAASFAAWITWRGVGRSGSPIPSEITSIPAARLSLIFRSSSAKTYGGRALMRRATSVTRRFPPSGPRVVHTHRGDPRWGELALVHERGRPFQEHGAVLRPLHPKRAAREPHLPRPIHQAGPRRRHQGGAGTGAAGHGLPDAPLPHPDVHTAVPYPDELHVGPLGEIGMPLEHGTDPADVDGLRVGIPYQNEVRVPHGYRRGVERQTALRERLVLEGL